MTIKGECKGTVRLMEERLIDGKAFADMLYGGAALLGEHQQEINDLNVFPVPDGDTGTNMSKTIAGGLSELAGEDEESVGEMANKFSRGVLLGARGNSGVILSQIFAGIGEELSACDKVGAMELANAYRNGIKKSYASVQNPTEGTILTVFREATEYAAENITPESTVADFYKLHIECARRSLEHTKEILPVLKEAGVVDSGAAGYLYIVMGMYEALTGELVPSREIVASSEQRINIDLFTRDSRLEFGYCTEVLIRLTTDKVDPDSFEIERVLSVLEELHGESVVAYKTGDVVKVHVHSFTPGMILSRLQEFGEFLTVKIENMSLGHSGEAEEEKPEEKKLFATLAVACGEGMSALFRDMGADGIIAGGQTQNPSTEEFISEFKKHNAEHIIVLPNNKNVYLAAKQAAELYEDAEVHIIKTKSLMQGYGALQVITPGISDMSVLVESIERAAAGVVGAEITRAVRDVTINGKHVAEGDYIAISEGDIAAVSESAEDAVMDMIATVDADDYEILTLFVGNGVDAERRCCLVERIEEEYPDFEITVYEGGQEVYDYLLALE